MRHQRTADKRMPLTDNKRSYKSLLIRYGTIFQGLQELINQRYRPLRWKPQADHIRTKPNGDKKETSPTISTYCRTFFYVSVLPERQKRGTKRHGWVSKSYPLPQKTIKGYDCRKSLSMQKVSISVLILDIIIWNLFYCDFFINGG